jgi:GT2 family glycosyltransferase/glycosyltransferase involved in cell wall biosynthesis
MATVDIVIPVFGALGALRRCVDSVLASSCRTPYEIIIVNDASGDAELARYLQELAAGGQATVIDQTTRQGYAAAVNRAFGLHRDRDAVVLQSDAEVANDWLDRLARHAAARDVGAVGTFTNNVGVATYPMPRSANPLPSGHTVATLDALFARANTGNAVALPAVDGPCLYFRRDCLSAVGAFDANPLGSDYGVEIDFCLRAGSAGYGHLLAGDVFVGHEGHASFGAREAESLAHRAEAALAKLYPSYLAQKKELAEHEPGRPFARRVDLLRLAESGKRILVFVSHPWGGGIRRYMNDLVALTDARCEVLFLEPAVGDTVKLSWPQAGESFALYFTLPAELPMLAETLRTIGVERLHFHHIHLQPRSILELPALIGAPYDYTLHDYHPICPQYHLVTEDGRYCGEPDAAGCAACLAKRPGQWGIDITTWRGAFGRVLRGANRVIAPSQDIATRMRRYFPELPIEVWPHPEGASVPLPRIARVAILGNLSPEKGLHVVAACARDARERGLPLTFRILGSTTEPIPQAPEAPLTIYGQYVDSELPQLIAAEKPDVLLFAAQVPETYAYTLSVALRSGLPIVASALGAFPERLAGVPRSTTVAWNAPPAKWNDALLAAAGIAQRGATVAAPSLTRVAT